MTDEHRKNRRKKARRRRDKSPFDPKKTPSNPDPQSSQKQPAPEPVHDPTPAPKPVNHRRYDMSRTELRSMTVSLLCEGNEPSNIHRILSVDYGVSLKRGQVYNLINEAARQKSFSPNEPADLHMGHRLMRKYPHLRIEVAQGPSRTSVANLAARGMWQEIRQVHIRQSRGADGPVSRGVHLGLSGGYTVRDTCGHFSNHLVRHFLENNHHPEDFPSKLWFHALVAGFETYDPTTEPNAMFTSLRLSDQVPIDIRFVALHAPPVVLQEQYESTKSLPGIAPAFEEAKEIDIVVTSMGMWSDPDCMLRRCMASHPESFHQLEKYGIIGDLMWRPIGEDGPITGDTAMRAMTVLELADLNTLIRRNGSVILVVGPCQSGQPKTKALRTLLRFDPCPVTHLVLDSRTARELLDG